MGSISQMASGMEDASSNNSYSLVNIQDYQSAQALAKMALEIFNNDLKDLGLTQVHPNLQKAFNL